MLRSILLATTRVFSHHSCTTEVLSRVQVNSFHQSSRHDNQPKRVIRRENPALQFRGRTPSEVLAQLPEKEMDELRNIKIEFETKAINRPDQTPSMMNDEHWLELLKQPSYNARNRCIAFMLKREIIRQISKEKKSAEERIVNFDTPKPDINRMFRRVTTGTINMTHTRRQHNAILWGQPIVFDMSFENHMRTQDARNLCKQLQFCYSSNKSHRNPFHFTFANLDPDSDQCHYIKESFIPKKDQDTKSIYDLPFTVSSKSYKELYPDSRLIYLTPDSPNYFHDGDWDHSAVYIIGGVVDKVEKKPFTYSKARREGIETFRLPLDRHVAWKKGGKSLTLNTIIEMLLIARDTNGDWKKAVTSCIPSRALIPHKSSEKRRLESLLKRF